MHDAERADGGPHAGSAQDGAQRLPGQTGIRRACFEQHANERQGSRAASERGARGAQHGHQRSHPAGLYPVGFQAHLRAHRVPEQHRFPHAGAVGHRP